MNTKYLHLMLIAASLFFLGGCAGLHYDDLFDREYAPETKEEKGPKTLLTWAVGPEEKKDDDDKNGDDKKNGNGKNGDDKKNGNGKNGDDKKNGNGANGNGKNENGKKDGEEERDIIATDRPDFVEASHAVGKGRVQLEAGYTYYRDRDEGKRVISHSYPEALLRIGMFADWFEFRIGQNMGGEFDSSQDGGVHGAQDLYLGVRFDLTEQKGIYPEASLVLQTTVPTGHRAFKAEQLLPGFNLLYGWDIVEDRWTLGASTQVNRRVDDSTHFYAEFAQAFTLGRKWTPRLGQYTEWFVFVPCGATTASAKTEHYLDGGFTYLITDNFQIDIRAGVGLNRAANDFFAGSGFGIRY